MNNAVKMSEKELQEELQKLLQMGEEDDGEEVFSSMLDDLIYLASLLDLQGSLCSVALICGDRLPGDAWDLGRMIQAETEQILQKWERYAEPTI